jgi:ribosomal protein S18 acetylase RimI-like enzyme
MAGLAVAEPALWAFVKGALISLAGFTLDTIPNLAHRGRLGGMYVRPGYRSAGAATALVEAVLAHARPLVEQVHLSITEDNEPAVRFYRRMGFVVCGREPRGLKHGDSYYNVLLMVRFLGP